ncbi:MAG: tyrosine--tRNA ligase [Chloroflexota bacterium]
MTAPTRILPPDLHRLLRRAVAEIIVEEELIKLLASGETLRLKLGFDPSRPDLHLGHAVVLRKLRQFQELGHLAILIVGDWTAQIGDPSGQSVTRPMLSAEEVKANAQTYLRQFYKIVDPARTEIVWQSTWYDRFTLKDVISLTSRFTVAQFLAREDFARRFAERRPIALTELLYPLLQAYDSVAIRADVEFGGIDQKFNILVGRELQSMLGMRPQQAFLTPILRGTDGVQKMSKSLNNYIAFEDPPDEMFGKIMSIPDELIVEYFELLTDIPDAELAVIREQVETKSVNPMLLKKRLGIEIVKQFHSEDAALAAAENFERVHQRRELPEVIPEVRLGAEWFAGPVWPADLLYAAGLVPTKKQARRLLVQGGVRVDGRQVPDEPLKVEPGVVVQVGRRKFARLVQG